MREWFDEVKGKKGLVFEGVRYNDVVLALTVTGFTKEEGMVFKAWLE